MAKHHGMIKRAKGGKAQVVSGNKNVIEEAEEDKTGDDDKVKRKAGGKERQLHETVQQERLRT